LGLLRSTAAASIAAASMLATVLVSMDNCWPTSVVIFLVSGLMAQAAFRADPNAGSGVVQGGATTEAKSTELAKFLSVVAQAIAEEVHWASVPQFGQK
jgi:hypothetical protein